MSNVLSVSDVSEHVYVSAGTYALRDRDRYSDDAPPVASQDYVYAEQHYYRMLLNEVMSMDPSLVGMATASLNRKLDV